MRNISKKLNLYVQISQKVRGKILGYIVRQDEELLYEAFVLQKDHIFALSKHKDEDKSILYYSAFVLAVNDIYNQMHPEKVKNKSENLNEIDDPISLRVKNDRKQKPTPKWDRMLNLKTIILKLYYKEGLAYAKIEEYLLKYHRLKVSHTHIGKFIKTLRK